MRTRFGGFKEGPEPGAPRGPEPGAPRGRCSPAERRESQGAPAARLCEFPEPMRPRGTSGIARSAACGATLRVPRADAAPRSAGNRKERQRRDFASSPDFHSQTCLCFMWFDAAFAESQLSPSAPLRFLPWGFGRGERWAAAQTRLGISSPNPIFASRGLKKVRACTHPHLHPAGRPEYRPAGNPKRDIWLPTW